MFCAPREGGQTRIRHDTPASQQHPTALQKGDAFYRGIPGGCTPPITAHDNHRGSPSDRRTSLSPFEGSVPKCHSLLGVPVRIGDGNKTSNGYTIKVVWQMWEAFELFLLQAVSTIHFILGMMRTFDCSLRCCTYLGTCPQYVIFCII